VTSRDFCYWLQGYFELSLCDKNKEVQAKSISIEQTQIIKNHLAMVFAHEIDPSHGSKEHQDILSKIHLSGFETKVNC